MIKNRTNDIQEEKGRISSSNYSDYYSTFDLGVAAALVSNNFSLFSLEKSNPKKVQFIFIREADIEKIVHDYFSDQLKINARTLFDNTKMLKNRIYSE